MRKSRADKEFWVIDFGISKQLLTSSGEVGGSVHTYIRGWW